MVAIVSLFVSSWGWSWCGGVKTLNEEKNEESFCLKRTCCCACVRKLFLGHARASHMLGVFLCVSPVLSIEKISKIVLL